MFTHRTFTLTTAPALAVAILLTLGSGCSPATDPGVTAHPPAAVPAADETAERAPVGDGPEVEDAPAPDAPAAEEHASTDTLPEVVSLNTKQLGGLLNKTLGKVTVLNIWATWCGPCVHEMPDLVKFYNEMDRSKIEFISVSIDTVDEISGEIPKFQATHKVTFPIYVLNERDDEALLTSLRAQFRGGIPTTFIYDTSGKMVTMMEGAVTLSGLQEALEPLLTPAS